MAKVIRLTESELTRIVKRIISEQTTNELSSLEDKTYSAKFEKTSNVDAKLTIDGIEYTINPNEKKSGKNCRKRRGIEVLPNGTKDCKLIKQTGCYILDLGEAVKRKERFYSL